MKAKLLHEMDFSKIEIREAPGKEGKFVVNLNPAGVQMTLTVSAESEEKALEKAKDMLRKQIERSGHQVIEGNK